MAGGKGKWDKGIDMQLVKVKVTVYLFTIISMFGCAVQKSVPPEPAKMEQVAPATAQEPDEGITPEMVEEYARIHQISDLKTAEFYLKNPDYARENPYKPTEEDLAFYEREFLERLYPEFKKLAEKEGFMKARNIYMDNPPFGAGSRRIGTMRYNKLIQQLASGGGDAAPSLIFENDPAGVYYQEAMKLYKDNRLDDAIEQMEKALKVKPDAPAFLYNLGVMYMEKENYARATQLLQSSLEYIKGTGLTRLNLAMYSDAYLGALTNLGLIYIRIGMYNEAVKVLKEAIRFKPEDVDANFDLGTAYYLMGDIEKANEQMRRCIDLDPNDAEVHNIIGLMYYRRELYNAALDEFQIAAKLNPEEKQYSYNLGLVLAKLGLIVEANQTFDRASGLKDGEDMRQTFAKETKANKVRELYNEGHSAMENLNWDQAIELFKAVLELDPNMMEAHFNLGVSYKMKGDKQNQIHHFKEAVRLKPDMPDVRYNLGLAYSDAWMYQQAIDEFKKATQLNPSFKEAHFQLGMAFYKTENYNEAAAEFEKCLELSPDWFEAHLNLGTCYVKIKEADRGMERFKEAVRLKPNSAEAHYNLGAVYMNTGKYDEAAALFQKALEIDPGYRPARIMLKEIEAYLGK